MLKVTRTAIVDVMVLEPQAFQDERGCFTETWNQDRFDTAVGQQVRFVQDNHSRSARGVLRGLHYQLAPHGQGKLVRASRGSIYSVAVDLRRNSPSFGHWTGVELSERNRLQLWLPPGMAHGFLALSRIADCQYKVSEFRTPAAERCVRWDDPSLAIGWPDLGRAPQLSPRDTAAPWLAEADLYI